MTQFWTANFGRAKTAAPIRASMDAVEHGLAHLGDVVLCTQEIDEGDKTHPTDHELLQAIFGGAGWQLELMDGREPMALLTDRQVLGAPVAHRAAAGVTHQSPSRDINELVLAADHDGNADTAVLGGHYPAGAKNGHRSPKAHAALLIGYLQMMRVHRRRIRHHLKAGRNVVWCMDTNWRNFPPLHRREVPVFHTGPDYIRAIPAKGRAVKAGPVKSIGMSIENKHDAHGTEIHFPKETR